MRVRATLTFAVAPEGDTTLSPILETLYAFRGAVRYVAWWCVENRVVSLSRVHKSLYKALKGKHKLPARLALDAIRQGIWIAKGWLRNPRRGRRPVIKRLWMVLTPRQSYTFSWTEASILTLNGRVRVGLVYVERWHGRYRDWRIKEGKLLLRDGKLLLHVTVEKDIETYKPRDVLGVDINYSNVTLSSGIRIEVKTFKRAYSLKRQIEAIQRRHPRGWRFIPQVRRRIKMLGRKMHNVIRDACWKIANEVVKHALASESAIALEDLNGLRNRVRDKPRDWRLKLALFAYSKLQWAIEWKARQHGVPIIKVPSKGTSSICPRCRGQLKRDYGRTLRCPYCGLMGDRDHIASLNIRMRGAQATLIAPDPDDTTRMDEGEVGKLGAGFSP